MSCGCRPVAEVRAEDRSEVTSVSRKRGQGRTPRRGTGDWRVVFSRITFSFFEATSVHCASDAVIMVAYVGCCVGSGTGGGGGLMCANNKPSTPRYLPLGKPAHPTDRPTGTIKQQLFFGGPFFFACALRLSSRSNQAAATSRTTKKMSPYFCIV